MTDRGRPVALLAPLPEVGPLERLRATGEVSKADGKLTEPPPLLQLAPGQEPPSKILARCSPSASRRCAAAAKCSRASS